jgi:hypothetical protein
MEKTVVHRTVLIISRRVSRAFLFLAVYDLLIGCAGLPYKLEWIIPSELSTYPLLEGTYIYCDRGSPFCVDADGKHVFVNLARDYYEITSDGDSFSDGIAEMRLFPTALRTDYVSNLGSKFVEVNSVFLIQQRVLKAPSSANLDSVSGQYDGDIFYLSMDRRNSNDVNLSLYVPKCSNTDIGLPDNATPKKFREDTQAAIARWEDLIRDFGHVVSIEGENEPVPAETGRYYYKFNCRAVDLQRSITLGNILFNSSGGYNDLLVMVRGYKLISAREPRIPSRSFE